MVEVSAHRGPRALSVQWAPVVHSTHPLPFFRSQMGAKGSAAQSALSRQGTQAPVEVSQRGRPAFS